MRVGDRQRDPRGHHLRVRHGAGRPHGPGRRPAALDPDRLSATGAGGAALHGHPARGGGRQPLQVVVGAGPAARRPPAQRERRHLGPTNGDGALALHRPGHRLRPPRHDRPAGPVDRGRLGVGALAHLLGFRPPPRSSTVARLHVMRGDVWNVPAPPSFLLRHAYGRLGAHKRALQQRAQHGLAGGQAVGGLGEDDIGEPP